MSIDTFIKRVTFDYDEKTIYNLMKKYNYNYSTSLVYLDNLNYISNKLTNNKMVKLKEIKEYLDNNNLLIYDNLFKEYVKDKEIYIYGYDYINKYYKSILDNYNYKVIDYEYKDYAIKDIYEFNYIDDEVLFVIDNICNLISKNINISKIEELYNKKLTINKYLINDEEIINKLNEYDEKLSNSTNKDEIKDIIRDMNSIYKDKEDIKMVKIS